MRGTQFQREAVNLGEKGEFSFACDYSGTVAVI